MAKQVQRLVQDLEKFSETWISNPAARLEFVGLVEAVRQAPSHDHADAPLVDWIDGQRRALRSIGMR